MACAEAVAEVNGAAATSFGTEVFAGDVVS